VTAPTVDSWAVVTRAQSGDADAFADIYRTHNPGIVRFIDYRVGSRSVAEDLAQDVWVKALRNIGTVEYQGRDIGSWLTTIARNLVADYFKSARFRTASRKTIDDLIAERYEPVADDDPEAETAAAIQCRAAELLIGSLLDELTSDQRRVLHLRFWDELSTVETAAVMGKAVGAVKASQSRGCASLRRALGGAR
jgi:RNA polymerase sigma-70 factor (ECF subfamily)